MRLGIFGGSFDPVHRGHLVLADCCRRQARLGSVWFVPASCQPLKPQGPRASDAHRLAMLQLACASQAAFETSAVEIQRGGLSYTMETLQAIHDEQPEAQLFFLMGADSLCDLPYWHRPADICRLATPLVVRRAGTRGPDFSVLRNLVSAERLAEIRHSQVEMPATPISSSEIRKRIAAEEPWEELVSPEVADYMKKHGLYVAQR